MKRDIKNYTLEELEEIFSDMGQPRYRAGQLFNWIYHKALTDINAALNIPRELREKLDQNYYVGAVSLSRRQVSRDGTEKFLFELSDGKFIETVLIPSGDRKTVCLSTQVGCKFKCLFCASAAIGFKRNLTPSEITSQISFLKDKFGHKLTNFVFMGIGEPLDNFDNLAKAVKIMNNAAGMNIGARRITISTCGLIPGIRKLEELGFQVNLSVSLHAVDNQLRNKLVPVNRRYPLEQLIKSCENFMKKTGRIITLEYILIKDKNDFLEDADELARIAKALKAKVNLIACNKILGKKLFPPSKAAEQAFFQRLKKLGANVTLRESRGSDIEAACGQLAGNFNLRNSLKEG